MTAAMTSMTSPIWASSNHHFPPRNLYVIASDESDLDEGGALDRLWMDSLGPTTLW